VQFFYGSGFRGKNGDCGKSPDTHILSRESTLISELKTGLWYSSNRDAKERAEMEDDLMFVECPNRHNIPVERAEGELEDGERQRLACPTCGSDCVLDLPFPVAVRPVSIAALLNRREAK